MKQHLQAPPALHTAGENDKNLQNRDWTTTTVTLSWVDVFGSLKSQIQLREPLNLTRCQDLFVHTKIKFHPTTTLCPRPNMRE